MPKPLERFGSLLMMNKTHYRVAKSWLKNTLNGVEWKWEDERVYHALWISFITKYFPEFIRHNFLTEIQTIMSKL